MTNNNIINKLIEIEEKMKELSNSIQSEKKINKTHRELAKQIIQMLKPFFREILETKGEYKIYGLGKIKLDKYFLVNAKDEVRIRRNSHRYLILTKTNFPQSNLYITIKGTATYSISLTDEEFMYQCPHRLATLYENIDEIVKKIEETKNSLEEITEKMKTIIEEIKETTP